MKKSSKLFLSLLVISGMILNSCGGAEEILDAEENTMDVEVDLNMDEDGKSGEEEDEEPAEVEADEAAVEESTPVEEPAVEEPAVVEEEEPVSSADYVDGTYSANGSYQTPSGPETVGVSMTIENDIVTSVSISNLATHETGIKFQDKFAGGVSAQVLGVDLDQLSGVGNVAGSSLTPNGFNNALASIKAQAAS